MCFLSTSVGNVATTIRPPPSPCAARCFLRHALRHASVPQFLNYSTSYCLQAVGDGRDTLLHAVVPELVLPLAIAQHGPFM
jgi:hypothetical protein